MAYTAGEAIGPDLFLFYRSLGINLKQLYGMTESSVFLCIQKDGEVRPDTVGPPIPGVELRIAEDGEVQFRSPGAFQSYYKNPAATAEAKQPDGWVHTGDAGFFDADGQLTIVDRARDVGRLANGALFAPKFIENKLKFFAYIKEAVAFGDGRICHRVHQHRPRRSATGPSGAACCAYQELAANRLVRSGRGCIAQANRDLAAEPSLPPRRSGGSHPAQGLDADDGALTRPQGARGSSPSATGARRGALFGAESGRIETEMTSRTAAGHHPRRARIRDVPPCPPRRRRLRRRGAGRPSPDAAEAHRRNDPRRRCDRPLFWRRPGAERGQLAIRKHEISRSSGRTRRQDPLLNVINGFYHPQRGTLTGRAGRAAACGHEAAAQGIARTFQNVALSRHDDPRQHIMGALPDAPQPVVAGVGRAGRKEELLHRAYVERIIDFLEIEAIARCRSDSSPMAQSASNWRALAMMELCCSTSRWPG